jgi:DNA-binding response OmpR family regulator
MSPRLLLVEDEPLRTRFLAAFLARRTGFAVDRAAHLEAAGALLRSQRYGAVITDLPLAAAPNRNGLQAIRLARHLQPAAAVLLLGNGFTALDEMEAKACGAHAVLSQPVNLDALLHILKGLLAT